MCGIAGIFSVSNQCGDHLKYLVRMTDAMQHRGPDDEGYMLVNAERDVEFFLGKSSSTRSKLRYHHLTYVNEALETSSVLVMGHRRLSILDPSAAGHQPMTEASKRYTIVFNGEIYNFKEIKSDLASLGYTFISSSDTEVILAAYSEWKENAVGRFNGDFAFAIWDNVDQSLFCARDRIGIKPFYYVICGDKFLFASDIKTLIASGLYRPQPDAQGLYLAMSFGIAPRPITAFHGVQALEQGHWMRIYSNGHIEKNRYWNLPVGTQDKNMSETYAVELIEHHLRSAISLRLAADVPVGTFMSGGIDSTTISAIASLNHSGIKAFTLGYQDSVPEMDEVPQAQATAQMYDIKHIVKRVNPDQSLGNISQWIKGYEEPFYSLAANFEISKLVKESNVTVVLNGLGGDELFAGYDYYNYHQFPHSKYFQPFSRSLGILLGRRAQKMFSLLGSSTMDRMHTVLFRVADDTDLRKLFCPNLCPIMSTPDILHNLYARDVDFGDLLEAFSYMDIMNYIGNHHVHRLDQFTMAHSIEGRFPFLDHNLIEAAFTVPTHLKIKNNQQKYILRRIAEKFISPECLSMKKKGFGLPLAQWMKGPLDGLVSQSLDKLASRPEVQAKTINKWHFLYQHGRLTSQRIWHLVALELWFEEFIDGGVPTDVFDLHNV